MSMVPSNVRNGLKTNLTAITGLRCFDIVPDTVPLPAAVVGQLDFSFDASMVRGLDTAECEILLIVGRMSERAGQNRLDLYLSGSGSSSIKAAIEADKTLGGACSTLRVTTATAGTITNAGADMLAYRYRVEIIG